MKALDMMGQSSVLLLRCHESGEVFPIATWAERIAAQRGISVHCAKNRLWIASAHRQSAWGLHFSRVDNSGKAVTPEGKKARLAAARARRG